MPQSQTAALPRPQEEEETDKSNNKHKPNNRTKSTKISSLFPKRGNRNTKGTEKHKNKMTHGKTYNKSPRRINHKATKSKTNTGTTALERSVEQTTGGFKVLLQLANFTLGPDATLNTEIHKNSVRITAPNSVNASKRKHKNQINHYNKQRRVLMANSTVCQSKWKPLVEPRGLQGYTLFLLFLLKNIDCGYSLEPPRRGGSNGYPQSMLWAEIWKISDFFIWKFAIFWW